MTEYIEQAENLKKNQTAEGWTNYFAKGGTYETEFLVERGIKEDIVYQSKYLNGDWNDEFLRIDFPAEIIKKPN